MPNKTLTRLKIGDSPARLLALACGCGANFSTNENALGGVFMDLFSRTPANLS